MNISVWLPILLAAIQTAYVIMDHHLPKTDKADRPVAAARKGLFGWAVRIIVIVSPWIAIGYFNYPKSWPSLMHAELQTISERTFINERVLLDGFKYIHCKFINVTFVYNGGDGGIAYSEIGARGLTSDIPEINRAVSVLNNMGFLGVPFIANGQIVPPFGTHATIIPGRPTIETAPH